MPKRILITGGSGSYWCRHYIGSILEVEDKPGSITHTVIDSPHNRSVLNEKHLNQLKGEQHPIEGFPRYRGLSVMFEHCKLIDLDTNKKASSLLSKDEY